MDIKALGARIAHFRGVAGLSQDRLALEAKVARNLISSLEKGKGNPTIGTLEALADTLGVKLGDLLPVERTTPVVEPVADKTVLEDAAQILQALATKGSATRLGVLYMLTLSKEHEARLRDLGAGPIAQALAKLHKVLK